MRAAEALRAARRQAGLSQRSLASAAGVHRSTVDAIEAGRREPALPLLQSLLQVAGLELTVDRVPPEPCRHIRRHLHLSLSARLHLLLGGDGRPRSTRSPTAWHQLDLLAAHGELTLAGPAAVALWVPGLSIPRPLVLHRAAGTRPLPAVEGITVRTGRTPECTVTVPLPVRHLATPPPGALALQPDCAPWRPALRSVARLLEEQAPLDDSGRRTPAHREPQREDEAWRLLFARRWNSRLRPPDRLDGRGWRLDDEASLRQWIERRAARD